jgi:hypothetical protein
VGSLERKEVTLHGDEEGRREEAREEEEVGDCSWYDCP